MSALLFATQAHAYMSVHVTWYEPDEIKLVCSTSKACAFLSENVCYLHSVKPKNFNDHLHLAEIGKAMQDCVKTHENNNKQQ